MAGENWVMGEPIIRMLDVYFTYTPQSEPPVYALEGINLEVHSGEYLVIVGHNGSGKSTLAKLVNALLRPTRGDVLVNGMNTRQAENVLPIRATVGMVFQNPDNQIVATIVEEDVAFGPANLGVPEADLRARVDWALEAVGMDAYRQRAPHLLSAGQKQRVAIAGAMALKPSVLILDESTAMLDPAGREDVLAAVRALHRQGVTIITITHFMHEAVEGDRIIVMEAGRIVMEGTPRDVFSQVETLRALHLDVPQVTELSYELHQRDTTFPANLLTVGEVTRAIQCRLASGGKAR